MGCVAPVAARPIPAGEYLVGPVDWESEHVASERGLVPPFFIDAIEVTWDRYFQCAAAGKCPLHTNAKGAYEPGQPVTSVDAEQARSFCAWAGGRLPRRAEWLRVTAGAGSKRFPWGQTGLVCRRAAYGLVHGPCAEGAVGPELSGSRSDGISVDGVFDLVGNVGELVEGGEGQVEVRGGSFRSDHAAELKSWAVLPYSGPQDDVGFRCVYDTEPGKTTAG